MSLSQLEQPVGRGRWLSRYLSLQPSRSMFNWPCRRRACGGCLSLSARGSERAAKRSAARFALRPVSLHRAPGQGRSSSLRCAALRALHLDPARGYGRLAPCEATDRPRMATRPAAVLGQHRGGKKVLAPSLPRMAWAACSRGEHRSGPHAACACGDAAAPAGLSVTAPGGVQSRVAPLQRSGCMALACV